MIAVSGEPAYGRASSSKASTQTLGGHAIWRVGRMRRRNKHAGVKFIAAGLLGLPLRVTISRRAPRGGAVRLKERGEGELRRVPLDRIMDEVVWLVAHREQSPNRRSCGGLQTGICAFWRTGVQLKNVGCRGHG